MEFFQHRYYRLVKTLMTLIGLWPYQSTCVRRGFFAVLTIIAVTEFVPLILAYMKYRDDWRIVLDCVIPWLFASMSGVKLIGFLWNSEKTLKLWNGIFANWQVWAQDNEVTIIHEYARQGEKMALVYTDLSIFHEAAVYTAVILFTTQPMVPKIMDLILKNGTVPGKFPYPIDYYFFDAQKYYYYVMVHFYLGACLVAMPLTSSDTMLIICAQHVCGVFATLGYKLEQIGSDGAPVEKGEIQFKLNKRNLVNLAALIDRHNDAIEYANLIDTTYTWNFFFTIGIGLILVNIVGLQILMRTDDPESTIRYAAMILAQGVVYYSECYFPQIVEDHSINIGYYIYNSRWYRLSTEGQKLLQFMTMRCRIPCQITAGKMVTMSFRTFGLTARTAMSYFAVVRTTL